ncbi:telomere length regulation protein elg1 [Metarhizium acridum CQMa 102]|uniref:Telomere length regulation protein elg1 n=1 Tax=Metarhizium acridum (strain CQMa 102) TaxID=655827 RepID=E9DVG6_METAQ|nr:telomere length regulation protein elg1 [Metarhizium acridum CQMa 102]EFY92343.1 telomere length regulation protein elg1 [Metarhizium acridum CQMa 102]
MGPVLVGNMGQSGIGEPSSRKLHPFFANGASGLISTTSTSNHTLNTRLDSSDISTPVLDAGGDGYPARKYASENLASQYERNSGTQPLSHAVDAPGAALTRPLSGPSQLLPPSKVTEQDTSISTENQYELQHLSIPSIMTNKPLEDVTQCALPTTSIDQSERNAPSQGKKVLRLNPRTGTLGSPPKTKQKSKRSLIVCIKYGRDEKSRSEIGEKITRVLDGSLQLPKTPTKQRSNQSLTKTSDIVAKPSTSTKGTHPFFSGKPKPRSSAPTPSTDSATRSPAKKDTVFMSTPVSPRRPRNPFSSTNTAAISQFGVRPRGTKVPGAKHPMWPAQGMSHVRGNSFRPPCTTECRVETGGHKKSKGQVTTIGPNESVLAAVVDRIDVAGLRHSLPQDNDSFNPAPAELRIPQKRCESGSKLQRRIRRQLTITSPLALAGIEDPCFDELAGPAPMLAHPAISRHYISLGTHLSAYDRSTCEGSSWNQKYAPVSAAQVLQNSKDALHIKQWLEGMKVQSVETGSGDVTGDKGRSKAESLPKKKRRKNKVDDFIVDTDEEVSDLEEISGSDGEGDDSSDKCLKSVVRAGGAKFKEPGQLRNSIVISGTNGCGKTAAVYAIAKELDFEIFEINSGARRSGKDVLERVGDMTRNHLVQQHRAQQPSVDGGLDYEGKESTKSGKQGRMTAFFKAKAAPEAKARPKQAMGGQTQKPSSKAQKQSLILIEEADILYEEDKHFWAVLTGMMNQSRRPFVITCNDESLVPLQSLNLHGIFRFMPAPEPLAVDLCLLIAANEGHSLQRSAVESLYRARDRDLRATISDLNFWCQIGVGDRKGGLDWFYDRWPKGCDLDDRGDVVRVISEDTYQNGMGWIGRDVMISECDRYDKEVEALQQSWNFWQVDMGDWCQSNELGSVVRAAWDSAETDGKRTLALEALEKFYQTMSDADICSAGMCATWLQEPVDPSLPDLTGKARDDFIIGRTLLEADGYTHPVMPSKTISMTLRSQARAQLRSRLQDVQPSPDTAGLCAINESSAISRLESSFHDTCRSVNRMDVAHAFDPIAVAPKAQPSSHLEPSVFDRTMQLIVLDVAPWIRGIVAFENQLMQERLKLSHILSDGGTRKRMRNTRSAYSALEGSERRSTRREQYFGDCLSTGLVMRTGGDLWQDAVAKHTKGGVLGTETPYSQQGIAPPPEKEMVL